MFREDNNYDLDKLNEILNHDLFHSSKESPMTKRNLLFRILFAVTFSLVFFSCEFETDRVYERKTEKEVTDPQVTVVDLNLEQDTIYLFTSRDVTFRFTSSNQEIEAVKFIIDGTEKGVYSSGEGVFQLDYGSLEEGGHTLSLEVITSSGSNSIADILGVEGYLFSNSWTLNVCKNYNSRLSTSVKDGCLFFSWKEYPAPDFSEYVIYREISYYGRVEAGRTTSPEFTDCSYAGEGGRYFVEVLKKDGLFFDQGWGYAELSSEIPRLSFTCSENNISMARWTKSPYYNAIGSVILSVARGNSWTFEKAMESAAGADTSWTVPAEYPFAEMIKFRLRVVPVNNVVYNAGLFERFETSLYDLALGYQYKPLNVTGFHLTQVSRDEFIYIGGCDSLLRYSVSELKTAGSVSYNPTTCSMCRFVNFSVSASGKFLSTIVDCDNDLMIASTGALNENSRYDLHTISNLNVFSRVLLSDSGSGLLTHPQSGFWLYDFNKMSVLGYYNNELYRPEGLALSSDGRYILLKDDTFRLVKFEDSGFIPVWHYQGGGTLKYCGFHATDPERLAIWDGMIFSVRNCSDFSESYSFPFTDASLLSIDYFNDEMLSYSPGHLFVRSLLNGSLIKDIPVTIDPTNWYYSCILVKHAVICSTGVMYFI
jgi:hypothetical protein